MSSNDYRLNLVKQKASEILEQQMCTSEVSEYQDIMLEYRDFFKLWYGEHSKEFMLANSVVNLIRLTNSPSVENQPLNLWIADQPIRKAWLKKIELALGSGEFQHAR